MTETLWEGKNRFPEQSRRDNRCATFSDGSSLRFSVDEYDDKRVGFNIGGSGEFGLEFYSPYAGITYIDVSDTVGSSTWKSDGNTDKFIAKCLVAFSTFLKRRYPWLKNASYSNNAIVDGIEEDQVFQDPDERRKAAEDALWRVKYYENLGFEFEVKYEDRVEGMLQDWDVDGVFSDESDEVTFEGNLVDIADIITSRYPQCKLVSLKLGPCP